MLIRYVGKTKLTDLPPEWRTAVDNVLEAVEKAVRTSPTSKKFF